MALVFGLGFRGTTSNPGWRLRCLCLGTGFSFAPPFLAGACGVCGLAWVLACTPPFLAQALGRAWLCALRMYPAIPSCSVRCGCVCLGCGCGCAPPLLAGVLGGVCVCVHTPSVARHSWLKCALWVCVLGLWLRLRPATPGWGVGVSVCPCACSACTPPLLAAVCGVGVCVWPQVSAAPHHSWLGCWGVGVFVCARGLCPATPGWAVRRDSVCLGSGFRCAPPLVAGVLGCVCVCVHAPLVPPHSWLGCAVWLCVSGLVFRLRPAILGAGVPVCVCVCVRSPLVPRHSWLGCAPWVSVLGLGFQLNPATPGQGVGVCVCLFARSPCTAPLLAGVCGVGLFACTRVSAAPRHSWLRCWGRCVFVCALCLYPATPG